MKKLNVLMMILIALAAVHTTVLAAPQPPEAPRIVEVENHGSLLVFYPIVDARQMILTVTGPCGYEFRQVSEGEEMVFKLDETTIDGMYSFSVTRLEKVDSSVINQLQLARKNFDEETPKKLCRQGRLPAPPLSQAAGFLVQDAKIMWDEFSVDEASTEGVDKRFDDPSFLADHAIGAGAGGIVTKDQVILDDLIVDGSACIGFDCVNGESFGFDTLRLKENNLRIKFQDTSINNFPSNDWQLTANDSANGGLNKFSIDDIDGGRTPFTIEARAPSHSLYVDDGGRLGLGTSVPVVDTHVVSGNTPTLRLEQNGSSGFAPQTWDVAGNETSFFVRDATNGSTLPFRIRPGSPSQAIVIGTNGDVGLGILTPAANTSLHVVANTGAANDVVLMQNNGATRFALNNTSHGDTWRFNYANSGEFRIGDSDANVEFQINGAGDVTTSGTVNGVSDRNKKKDFVSLDPTAVLDAVASLPISEWSYKHDPQALRHVGPMAQDFWAAFGLGMDDKHIALTDMSGVALAAIQGLNQELVERNNELETRLEALEALVAKLTATE